MQGLKLTPAQALALLKKAGAPVVEIVTDEAQASADFKEDTVLGEIDKARTPIIRPQIEGEIKEAVTKAANGTMSGTYKSAIARTFKGSGVTRSELDAIDNIDDLLKMVLEKHNSTFSKDSEEMRKTLEEVTTKHAETLKKTTEEWEGKYKAKEQELQDRDIDEVMAGKVKAIPRTGGNELTQAQQLKAFIREQYSLVYDPAKKALALRMKDNPEMPVYANDEKSRFLEVDDVAKTYFGDMGILAKDTRNQNPNDAMKNQQGNNSGEQQNKSSQDAFGHVDASAEVNRLLA